VSDSNQPAERATDGRTDEDGARVVAIVALVAIFIVLGIALTIPKTAGRSTAISQNDNASWSSPEFSRSGFGGKIAALGLTQLQCSALASGTEDLLDFARIAGETRGNGGESLAMGVNEGLSSASHDNIKAAADIVLAKGMRCIDQDDRPLAILCANALVDACAFEFKRARK
jgi:hypothetical protein